MVVLLHLQEGVRGRQALAVLYFHDSHTLLARDNGTGDLLTVEFVRLLRRHLGGRLDWPLGRGLGRRLVVGGLARERLVVVGLARGRLLVVGLGLDRFLGGLGLVGLLLGDSPLQVGRQSSLITHSIF